MPGIPGSAYSTVTSILDRARAILNDSAVLGGDVLTDDYPGAIPLINIAYETVQRKLATVGVEVLTDYFWLMALPSMPIVDPEGRLIVGDTGTNIIYPNGVADVAFTTPSLPPDMIVPLKLWERQNGTTNIAFPMKQPNDGLLPFNQFLFLVDWEYGAYQGNDCLIFRGAQQVQDVKIKYEKHLPLLATPSDPVPIRGVDNAAAYQVAKIFSAARGAVVAAAFENTGNEEIFLLQSLAVRRNQRKRSRRQPYSGRASWRGPVF